MTSCSSSLASSTPATSLNVTRAWFSFSRRARLLPKDMALPPPTCIWRMKKIHTPISRSMGNQFTSSTKYQGESSSGLAAMRMFFSLSVFTSPGSLGEKVRNRSPLWYLPWTCRP